jgi:CRISPR system Cascade subunit CasC
MNIEIHMIQNFAPSCLNRDDTNAPKDCVFGGVRRARISSQCIKRAVRQYFKTQGLLPTENIAQRTKRLVDEVSKRLVEEGHAPEEARRVVIALLEGVGLSLKEEETEYLLFLGQGEINSIGEICSQNWDTLVKAERATKPGEKPKDESRKEAKKKAKEAIPEHVTKAVEKVLNGGRAADLALFGRMLADLPEKNIDAACQVAHAISTHRVDMEFDFYTAVDDLQPKEEAGAGMMGTTGYNSACFYRYAVLDADQLKQNLGGDEALARRAAEAFLRAVVSSVPSGKQNTFAAYNPPSLIFVAVRENGAWNLANAFEKPVHARGETGLVDASILSLDDHYGRLKSVYGSKGILRECNVTVDDGLKPKNLGTSAPDLEQLIQEVMGAIRFAA